MCERKTVEPEWLSMIFSHHRENRGLSCIFRTLVLVFGQIWCLHVIINLFICCVPLLLRLVGGSGMNTRHGWVWFPLDPLFPFLFIFLSFLVVAVIDRAIWRCLAFHHLWGCQWLGIKILYRGLIFCEVCFFITWPLHSSSLSTHLVGIEECSLIHFYTFRVVGWLQSQVGQPIIYMCSFLTYIINMGIMNIQKHHHAFIMSQSTIALTSSPSSSS